MKINVMISFLIALVLVGSGNASAADYTNSFSFKVTIVENGTETEWEFENPDDYEKEQGKNVQKSPKIKREIIQLFGDLAISKDADVNEMVTYFQKNGHENMDRLDVRWIDKSGKLYTWTWSDKD